ncbi:MULTISPECIES: isocitrate lyase/PEP mutase family protein [Streptomyces]|uniref:Isocitrate lyase/phosphoenolpyruvate mutase family protein n=1 Tax=Streptomyces solicathayae TaxID=3081768 RepID=A0ABZ0LSV3_9ACTN|nr:isocitrate lyase/phosphoenolpyruvate mutase family protein [Streptomyces sp. HUAS YS2]WOX22563.1 isocitrate lyase/phosphoenolpyruvate mutase family protein [Streptomyces sp. HUAS YS2]
MSDAAHLLRELHLGRATDDPLVLPGPWDAASARAFEAAGFPALATPSAGIAAALGYEDGSTPADEMFAAVARIVRAVSVPVTADVEGGYGLAPEELVERVLETGAAGVNLEDSDGGALKDPHEHADRLAAVRAAAGDALFVNARVDVYLRGVPDPADAALERALLYAAAGADCVYPIVGPPEDLPALRAGLGDGLPVNVLARPGGPSFAELGRLGATRITFGGGLLERTLGHVRDLAEELRGA